MEKTPSSYISKFLPEQFNKPSSLCVSEIYESHHLVSAVPIGQQITATYFSVSREAQSIYTA